MVNVPLLRKELEHITAHPEDWDQGNWLIGRRRASCGTAGCLAGNTVLHDGWYPNTANSHFNHPVAHVIKEQHREASVKAVASDLLQLTRHQASVLFAGHNSLLDLWMIASELTNGEIEVPPGVTGDADDYELHEIRNIIQSRINAFRRTIGDD